MRKDITVSAEPRSTRGKNAAYRTRMSGAIPAVLYGPGGDSVAVAVNPKELNKILRTGTGHNTIFDLAVTGGENSPVMVIDWLHHPVRGSLMHVDFKRIDLTKRLRVTVPIHTTGDPVGVKIQGGMFELVNREVTIECLPDDIPEHFTIDVSGLELNQSIRAGNVPLSGSMKLLSPPELVVTHVVAIRGSDEAAATEEAEASKVEPEVIKKGKKEEEAAAPAEKGKKK